jgi:ADP-heptose:LPS heptosyltransferase
MHSLIISPYSKPLKTGQKNAKNYPFWPELVSLLLRENWKVIQIGVTGESIIPGITSSVFNASLEKLLPIVKEATAWISVDNFFPHFCAIVAKKPGIVLWGKSDPKIFGHPLNINLLKDRKYLKKEQFQWWHYEPFDPNVFVSPEVVITTLKESFSYANSK